MRDCRPGNTVGQQREKYFLRFKGASVLCMEADAESGRRAAGRGCVGAAPSGKAPGASGGLGSDAAVLQGNPPEMDKNARFLGLPPARLGRPVSPRPAEQEFHPGGCADVADGAGKNRESGHFCPFRAGFFAWVVRAGRPPAHPRGSEPLKPGSGGAGRSRSGTAARSLHSTIFRFRGLRFLASPTHTKCLPKSRFKGRYGEPLWKTPRRPYGVAARPGVSHKGGTARPSRMIVRGKRLPACAYSPLSRPPRLKKEPSATTSPPRPCGKLQGEARDSEPPPGSFP